jgi:hypothetical protein
VVYHQLHRLQWIDPTGISAELSHGVPHGGEVHHRGHAGEVLQQDPRGREGDLTSERGVWGPARQCLDILAGNADPVLGAEQVFQEDSEGVRQAGDIDPGSSQGVQPKDLKASRAYLESRSCTKRIIHDSKVSLFCL